MNKNNKKKWLILGMVGTALLLVPRRSSRQASRAPKDVATKNNEKNNEKNKEKKTESR